MSVLITKIANIYLARLAEASFKDVKTALLEVYSLEEHEVFKAKVEQAIVKAGFPSGSIPAHIYPGGTESLKKLVPEILPTQEKRVIDLLKHYQRIIQVGPGRGKLLILMFGNGTLSLQTTVPETTIDALDAKSILKSLSSMLEERDILEERYYQQQKTIDMLETKLYDLQQQQNIHTLTTWS